ncbi:hypothetical protein [Sphingobacterium kyonggiense]
MNEFVDNLNKKHKKYLEKEGRWLGGGFENVFINSNNNNNKSILKLEVFSMLPLDIKKEILEYI